MYRVVSLVVLGLACLTVANAESCTPDALVACCQTALNENPGAPEALPEYLLTSLNNISFIIRIQFVYFSFRIFDEPYAAILLPPPEFKAVVWEYFTLL